MKTEKIINEMRKRGYYLDLYSTIHTVKLKYSARFTTDVCIGGKCWIDFQHANTIKEVVSLAAIKITFDNILEEINEY